MTSEGGDNVASVPCVLGVPLVRVDILSNPSLLLIALRVDPMLSRVNPNPNAEALSSA